MDRRGEGRRRPRAAAAEHDEYSWKPLLLTSTTTTPSAASLQLEEEISMMVMTKNVNNSKVQQSPKRALAAVRQSTRSDGGAAPPNRFVRLLRAASCRDDLIATAADADTYVQLKHRKPQASPITRIRRAPPSTLQTRNISNYAQGSNDEAYGYSCYGTPSSPTSTTSPPASTTSGVIDSDSSSAGQAVLLWARSCMNGFFKRKLKQQQNQRSTPEAAAAVTFMSNSSSSSRCTTTASSFSTTTKNPVARSSTSRLQHVVHVVAPPKICYAAAGSVISAASHSCTDIHDAAVAIHVRRRSRRRHNGASFHYDAVSYALNFDDGPRCPPHMDMLRRTVSANTAKSICTL